MAASIIATLVLVFLTACGGGAEPKKPGNPAPPAPPTTAAANTYLGVGTVKSVNPKAPAVEIDHGDIDGLMPAMQMEFPVADATLLNGIAVNDQVDFTIDNAKGDMRIVAIKKK